jgi:hypothetical protein
MVAGLMLDKMDYRLSNRSLIGFATLIVLLSITDLIQAAEFSAETTIDQLGKDQVVKMHVKGEQIRVEMKDIFGQKQILIRSPDKGQKTFMLYPETKTYVELPAAALRSPVGRDKAALEKVGNSRLIGQETIDGYLCDKYEITHHNTYLGKTIIWFALKLDYPIQMIQIGGPPNTSMNRKLTNIKERRIDDSLFAIPSSYKKVKKPQGDCRAGYCRINFF